MKTRLRFLSSSLVSSFSLSPKPSFVLQSPYLFNSVRTINRTVCFSSNLLPSRRGTIPPLGAASSASVSSMAVASFKPEQARVPSVVPLPTPPITKFKIGLCQLSVTSDKERNILHARTAIEEAAGKGAKLVVLPEIWNSPYSNDSFAVYAEEIDAGFDNSPSTAMLSEVARLLKVTIVGGSIPERNGDKLYNTCCVFGTDGELKAKHRKAVHFTPLPLPL